MKTGEKKEIRLTICIAGYSKEQLDGRQVVLYNITLDSPMSTWTVSRRYNEFYELHQALVQNYKTVPKVPPKTFFSLTSDEELRKRKRQLQEFLGLVLELENIFHNVYFIEFLNLSSHKRELALNQPVLQCRYDTISSLTFTHLNVVHGRPCNYLLCSKGMKKAANYSSKLDLVENSNDIAHMAILNGFKFDSENPLNIFQDKKILKSFDLKGYYLEYFAEAAILVAGFSDGMISVYKEEKNNKLDDEYQLENIAKVKCMKSRVTKIMINSKLGVLYVVGEKFRLRIVDMATWTVIDKIAIGAGPILQIFLDEHSDFGFSSTDDGKLLIIDIAGERPVVHKTLQIAMGRLSCMDSDMDAGRIIVADSGNGDILVIDIDFPFSVVRSGNAGQRVQGCLEVRRVHQPDCDQVLEGA